MALGKSELKQKITLLEQGLPQKWIYIERKVLNPLSSDKSEGVKANIKFLNKDLSYIFHQDLLSVKNTGLAKIRPVIGPNGVGKTTQLKFQVRDYLKEIEPDLSIYLFFDFKQMANTTEEFWAIFGERLIEQIRKKDYLTKILEDLDSFEQRTLMLRNFKNKDLVDNLINLSSPDRYKQAEAEEFFYSGELKSKDLSNFFFGLLKLAFEHNYTVVILFDEIQFLDEIDPSNVLVKMFSEQFMRLIFEQFSKNRLYLVISCLQNPEKKEWDLLKSRSKNFQSIVEGKEIILGNLTINERKEIVNQVSSKIGFQQNDKSVFLSKVKSSLDYFLPRFLLQCIANILDMMEYTAYTDYEIRKLYEKDARDYISPKLKEKGFKFIESDVKKIGGYNVDIFATEPTSRSKHRKQAFGEVTMMKRAGMIEKVEKFATWLNRMKNVEYKPGKGDIAFLICPPNRITENSKKILDDNDIILYEYSSKNIEELFKVSKPQIIPEHKVSKEIIEQKLEEKVVIIKDSKYSLEDIKGIGATTAEKLRRAGITTLKELINCNSKTTASAIERVGKPSIDKWKQVAKQLLYG
ncbi:MAG: helix-hairpin-helix domain-containing protein [Promethearchaeota archaeon]